jgi:predicted transcriptional regulator
LRLEELQLPNENMLKLSGRVPQVTQQASEKGSDFSQVVDSLNRRIDELHLRNDILQKRANLFSNYSGELAKPQETVEVNKPRINYDVLFTTWKNYPGQDAKNEPNLRKQMQMLVSLFENESLNSVELFNKTGVNGVTGARYVGTLKKMGLIQYMGARKKGHYVITDAGKKLVESGIDAETFSTGNNSEVDFFNPADL